MVTLKEISSITRETETLSLPLSQRELNCKLINANFNTQLSLFIQTILIIYKNNFLLDGNDNLNLKNSATISNIDTRNTMVGLSTKRRTFSNNFLINNSASASKYSFEVIISKSFKEPQQCYIMSLGMLKLTEPNSKPDHFFR